MNSALPQKPGFHELLYDGNRGRYTLSIPAGDLNKPTPLIVVLHWGGPVTPFIGRSILEGLAIPALGDLGAIMAAPDCRRGGWDNPESEADVLELLSHLQGGYPLAPGKSLLLGYSMGGIGAWYLAAQRPESFAAAIVISSGPPVGRLDFNRRTPLYFIHSRQDEHFPYERTAQAIHQLVEQGAPVEFITIRGATHFNTAAFIAPLRDAKTWIQQIWREGEHP